MGMQRERLIANLSLLPTLSTSPPFLLTLWFTKNLSTEDVVMQQVANLLEMCIMQQVTEQCCNYMHIMFCSADLAAQLGQDLKRIPYKGD